MKHKTAPSKTATDANAMAATIETRAIKPGLPIEQALEPHVGALSLDLTIRRAAQVARACYQGAHGARKGQPIAVYPFTVEDDAVMLGFGLTAASLERFACVEIVRQCVDAGAAERIAAAIAQRGPLAGNLTASYNGKGWSAKWDGGTELALAK